MQILSCVAQTERESIRQQQAEGIAAAIAREIRFGKPPMERPALYNELRNAVSGVGGLASLMLPNEQTE